MRRRDEGFNEGWGQIATLLKIITPGGKQSINCVSTKGAFIGSPGYRLMETETTAEDREKFERANYLLNQAK